MPDTQRLRAQDALFIRLVWPVSALVLVALALAGFAVVWTALKADDLAREHESGALGHVIEDRLGEVRRLAVAVAADAGTMGGLGRTGRGGGPVSSVLLDGSVGVALLDASGSWRAHRVFEPAADGARAGPRPAAEERAERVLRAAAAHDPDGLAGGRLVFDGARPLAAASAPASAGVTAIAYRALPPSDLAALGRHHRIAGLAVATALPDPALASLPIPGDGVGEPPAAYLTWQPNGAGSAMRDHLLPPLLAGAVLALCLFGTFLASIYQVAGDLTLSRERAERLVGRDPLSGLPNRQLFADRLDQELARTARTGEGLAVLFLDLDRFKDVNDTFGHGVGDALLREVTLRLVAALRVEDTLARFGGDEFAVIQTRLGDVADAETLARRILDALTQPFVLGGTAVTVGASIGIALAPSDGIERETLMRLADTALYQAKSGGRNRFCFFAPEMDETIRMRKLVEDDLRRAISRDELVLHYQPIYSADGRRVLAVEALVRWPHPEHGMISPAKFVPVAEERGLVIPLGEWVMRRACRDAARWPGVRLAVNVSAIQFHHRDFVAGVLRATREAGFDPADLEIELTEGVLVDDEDAAEAAMMELRALGVRLALDDFGTGYSSLIYLRRFAFDKIKIDRSFLQSLEAKGESAILVHSIVHLGRALGLTVTAEGVETVEQHRFLQALGCHQLQGFLFSRPVPAERIDALLAGERDARAMPASNAA